MGPANLRTHEAPTSALTGQVLRPRLGQGPHTIFQVLDVTGPLAEGEVLESRTAAMTVCSGIQQAAGSLRGAAPGGSGPLTRCHSTGLVFCLLLQAFLRFYKHHTLFPLLNPPVHCMPLSDTER